MCDPLLCAIVDRAMANPELTSPKQPRLRSLLIGDSQAVWRRIFDLHRLGVMDKDAWSAVMPLPNTDAVISGHIESHYQPDISDRV